MKVKNILIGILIVLLIIIIVMVIKKELEEVQEPSSSTNNENSTQGKIEQFEEQLKIEGLNLSNKTEITSDSINETGYSYKLNNETIEIYNVRPEKMNNIIVNSTSNYEFIIRTRDGSTINAIYYNEILILNCKENMQDIIKVLEARM